MSNLTPRQEKFVRKYSLERLPAGVAYAEAYNRAVDDTAYTNASRLLRNAQIKQEIQDLSEQYKQDSKEAYEVQKELMRSNATPANVRSAIAKEIQDRAGYAPTKKIETTDVPFFPGLSDISREELKHMLR